MRIFIILLAAALAGCTQYKWSKPGASESDFKRDSYNCEKDMRQSGYFGTGLIGAFNARDFEIRCMEAQGYTKAEVR